MKIIFRIGDTLQVVSKGATSNDKIEANKKRKIVQTYTFSRRQFESIAHGTNAGMREFFSKADTNCLDCPFNEFGKCYTHKFNQYVGFISMLKSIAKTYQQWDDVPPYDAEVMQSLSQSLSVGTFVRFGTYGEPSLHPKEMIKAMVQVADNWTGYTHQWRNDDELGAYFMASTHTLVESEEALTKGYRSYIATPTKIDSVTNCPASKESDYKSSCSKCGLCSGTQGKGKKSIYILNH
jgi:hypothetical protein